MEDEQINSKFDEDTCNECSANIGPSDGGEYGRHDYGCSQGPWPDDEPIKECCKESLPHNCGDCDGGGPNDPYLDGENMFDPAFNAALGSRRPPGAQF